MKVLHDPLYTTINGGWIRLLQLEFNHQLVNWILATTKKCYRLVNRKETNKHAKVILKSQTRFD